MWICGTIRRSLRENTSGWRRPWHNGGRLDAGPFSAYVLHDRSFLQVSWHPDTSPAAIDFDDNIEWLGLEIVHTESGAALDSIGVVEFRARFSRSSENLELHERSSFVRVDGLWVYVSWT